MCFVSLKNTFPLNAIILDHLFAVRFGATHVWLWCIHMHRLGNLVASVFFYWVLATTSLTANLISSQSSPNDINCRFRMHGDAPKASNTRPWLCIETTMVTTGVPPFKSYSFRTTTPQVSGGLSNETFDQLLAGSYGGWRLAVGKTKTWMGYVMEHPKKWMIWG